jgi:hypothetical protein
MNFKQLLAGFEAAVPAVAQVVAAMHPENTAEGVKIAAGVQLFEILVAGVHQIAATSAAASAPVAAAAAAPAGNEGAQDPNVQPSTTGALIQLQ